jgi:murein DD-endopeptidase MepM/ murein hydrolase activator NlpD
LKIARYAHSALCLFALVMFPVLALADGCRKNESEVPSSSSNTVAEHPLTLSPLSWQLLGGELSAVHGSDGLYHMAYALQVTNSFDRAAELKSIEVLDGTTGKPVDAQSQVVTIFDQNVTGLIRAFSHPVTFSSKDFSTRLEAGGSGVIYVNLVFQKPNQIPDSVTHRFTAVTGEAPGERTFTAVDHARPVNCKRVTVLSGPLQGKGWVNGNGCCRIIGPHRFVINSINGELHATEEFAIDWIRLGEDNRAYHGDVRNLHNWYDYDAPVISASEGRVIDVRNDLKDEIPGKNPVGLPLDEIAGNHVIVMLSEGTYVEYDHLVPGSAAVAPGDFVQKGQLLGRLGNSGNSDAPHLHFQIMSRPSILDGWAVPFVFDSMHLEGTIPLTLQQLDEEALTGNSIPVSKSDERWSHHQMPLSLDVIEFP